MILNIEFQTWQVYTGLAITGTFIGIGNALGHYLFEEHIKNKTKKIIEKIKQTKFN